MGFFRANSGNRVTGGLKLMAACLCLLFCGAQAAQAQDITTGLVGYWKMDESTGTVAANSAGTPNGTMQGGLDAANDSYPGMLGSSLRLDGVNDGISLGNVAALNFDGVKPFTLSAWIKLHSNGSGGNIISKYGGGAASNNQYAMYVYTNNTPRCLREVAPVNVAGTTQMQLNTWYHMVCRYDGTTLSTWLNGVQEGSAALGSTYNNSTAVFIGANANTGDATRFFDGFVDEVRIYNRALTSADIAELYNVTYPGKMRFSATSSVPEYYDGTQWVGMGPQKYAPNAVRFKASESDFLVKNTDLTGNADTKQVTGSVWVRRMGTPGSTEVIHRTDGLILQFLASNELQVFGRNDATTAILNFRTTGFTITDNNWHHIVFSMDMTDSSKSHIYVDDVVHDESAGGVFTDDFLNVSNTQHSVGSIFAGGNYFDGEIADLWLDYGSYIDLSVESNRRKFISAVGDPIYLGANGEKVTGSAPDIFLSGDTASWQTNKGTGGGFTVNGALTTAYGPGDPTTISLSAMGASLTGTTKWSRGIQAPDNKIYGIPDDSTNILIIDPVAGTATRSAMGANLTGTNKWAGGVLGPDGKIYATPRNAADILVIDPLAGTATRTTMGLTLSDTGKWDGQGARAANGKLYFCPFNSTDILIIDPAAGTASRSTMGATLTGTSKWAGAVLGANGKIYCMPYNSTDILIIDPVAGTATRSTMGATLTGNGKWAGGALARNGKIYGVPLAPTNGDILVIDTAAGTATRTTMGADLITSVNKWAGPALGADGRIYAPPINASMTDTLIIDPLQNKAFRMPGATSNYEGIVAGSDGKLYAMPRDATQIMIVAPGGACTNPARLGGSIIYNDTSNVLQYCDGQNWIAMGPVPGAGGAGCSNPTKAEGSMIFNADYGTMQYCDGASWVRVGPISGQLLWAFDADGTQSGTGGCAQAVNGATPTVVGAPACNTTSGAASGFGLKIARAGAGSENVRWDYAQPIDLGPEYWMQMTLNIENYPSTNIHHGALIAARNVGLATYMEPLLAVDYLGQIQVSCDFAGLNPLNTVVSSPVSTATLYTLWVHRTASRTLLKICNGSTLVENVTCTGSGGGTLIPDRVQLGNGDINTADYAYTIDDIKIYNGKLEPPCH